MPELTLYAYTKRVDQLIARNSAEEAIAHCRQLLSHYPKYLPAYRLLARACLAKGDLAHASHFYQCVLSANPKDADAWLHLALLSSDLGELEQATWLMERAFEVEPGNAQIRSHLRQLYSRRDGVERTHIQLTAGALAHLYARAGFHKHAIRELDRLLQTSLDQSPLHIAHLEAALVESLWHTEGQAPLADRVCQSLLRKLPNCLQANLIMAQIRCSAGLEDEAEAYLQTACALDPEGQFAYAMMGDQAPVTRTEIEIPYLAYEAPPHPSVQPQPQQSTIDDTSWLDQVGKTATESEQLTPAPQAEMAAPDWLEQWPELASDHSEEVTEIGEMTGDSVDVREAPGWLHEKEEKVEQHADWLFNLQDEEPEEAPEQTPTPAVGGVGATADEQVSEATAADELPDWLSELSDQPETEVTAIPPAPPESDEGLPDWLAELQVRDSEEVIEDALGPAAEALSAEELPDWLQELSDEDVDAIDKEEEASVQMSPGEAAAEPEVEEQLPEWLRDLGTEEEEAEPAPADTAAVDGMGEEDLPAWLTELEAESSQEMPSVVEGEVEEQGSSTSPQQLPDERVPDWLRQLGIKGETDKAIAASEDAEEGSTEDSVPEWLMELETEEAEQTGLEAVAEGELPDWLAELDTDQEDTDATVIAQAPSEEASLDWLAETESEGLEEVSVDAKEKDSAAKAVSEPEEEELPRWLEELGEDVPEWLVERQEGSAPRQLAAEDEGVGEPVGQEESAPLSEGELPDWLGELSPEQETEGTGSTEALADIPAPELPPPEEGMPEWLLALEGEIRQQLESTANQSHPVPSESPVPEEGSYGETEPASETIETADVTEQEAVSAPESIVKAEQEEEWPTAESTESTDAEAIGEFTPDREQVPEWLAALEATVESDSAISTTQEELVEHPVETETVPEWLQELEQEAQVGDVVAEVFDAEASADAPELEKHPPVAEAETPIEARSPQAAAPVKDLQSDLATTPYEQETRLALAAAYLEEDNLDKAAQEYEQLVRVPSLLERVTTTLEKETEEHPNHHALQRVLGDAYMQAGELQKALAAYKRALATL